MSAREDIRDNLLTTLKAIPGVAEATDEFKRLDQIESTSRMPFLMMVSSDEDRERVNSQRDTQCVWAIPTWCFLKASDDLETWVERVRAAIMVDRSRGVHAMDTFISRIATDDKGVAYPNKYFLMIVEVTYRVRE